MADEAEKAETGYGLVMYDVPVSQRNLASRLKNRIRKFALWVNDSVYLFPWEQKGTVDSALVEVRSDMGDGCRVYAIRQHESTQRDLLNLARESVRRLIEEASGRLAKRIAAVPARVRALLKAGKIPEGTERHVELRRRAAVICDVKMRVELIRRHCFALHIEGETSGWVAEADGLIKAERAALEAARAALAAPEKEKPADPAAERSGVVAGTFTLKPGETKSIKVIPPKKAKIALKVKEAKEKPKKAKKGKRRVVLA